MKVLFFVYNGCMNEKTKNYLGWALIVGVLAVGVSALGYVGVYRRSVASMSPSFMVSGEGRVIAKPDIARVSFGVTTEGGQDLAGLQTENTTRVNKAIEFVKQQGVATADIQTENYQVSPRYQYCNRYSPTGESLCPPETIVGYTIEQTVSLKIRDFSLISPILSGVVQNGANRVWGLSFMVDDPTQFENDARAEAMAKAKAKAKSIASAGGFNLGALLSVDEGFYPLYAKQYGLGMGGTDAVSAPLPNIEPGSSEIIVSVNLRYAIK